MLDTTEIINVLDYFDENNTFPETIALKLFDMSNAHELDESDIRINKILQDKYLENVISIILNTKINLYTLNDYIQAYLKAGENEFRTFINRKAIAKRARNDGFDLYEHFEEEEHPSKKIKIEYFE